MYHDLYIGGHVSVPPTCKEIDHDRLEIKVEKRKRKQLPPREELLEHFTYDPDSGVITNKISRGTWAKAGAVAGSVKATSKNKKVYRIIRYKGLDYYAHVLAITMMGIDLPDDMEIDHENQCGYDNRLNNLRVVSRAENRRNLPIYRNNTSGVTGVTRLRGKWEARIVCGGKTKRLGVFSSLEDAAAARKIASIQFKFHENHGVRPIGMAA